MRARDRQRFNVEIQLSSKYMFIFSGDGSSFHMLDGRESFHMLIFVLYVEKLIFMLYVEKYMIVAPSGY